MPAPIKKIESLGYQFYLIQTQLHLIQGIQLAVLT